MNPRRVNSPTSRVRFGFARAEITPPVGIYHRMWGAARHDRATGVHRPLFADVMLFAPLDGAAPPFARVQLDLVGLDRRQVESLAGAVAAAAGIAAERVVVAFSHSHSAGLFLPGRVSLPGGDLIAPYLEDLGEQLQHGARRARESLQDAAITYATGRCAMNANRDYWDDDAGAYACGFNPGAVPDQTLVVARVTGASGAPIATVVNYGCHPTTLAWENTLLSPDYPGALRALVERETDAPCVFALGACGDLGPREGYTGDPAVADRNGRQVGYAALSLLEEMGPPGVDFDYAGPVVSGATLGRWEWRPFDADRSAATARFEGGSYAVDLPLRPLPERASLERDLATWEADARAAEARREPLAARDAAARAERARRWLGRLADLPPGPAHALRFSVLRMGDSAWVTCAGEPYSVIQEELRRRFPDLSILFSPLAGEMQVAYLLPRDRYGQGLYQEEPSLLAPGCLETLTEAIAARIEDPSLRPGSHQ